MVVVVVEVWGAASLSYDGLIVTTVTEMLTPVCQFQQLCDGERSPFHHLISLKSQTGQRDDPVLMINQFLISSIRIIKFLILV